MENDEHIAPDDRQFGPQLNTRANSNWTTPVTRSYSRIVIVAAFLAALGSLPGCVQKSYWVAPYSVAIRVRAGDENPIAGVVAKAFYREEYDKAKAVLEAAPANTVSYLDLLEMNSLKARPLGNEGVVDVDVMRHGVDHHFPQRSTVKEYRQEKVVLGVFYVDGTKKCFVFDVPPPDRPREIIAEIPTGKGEQSLAAESR